MANRLRRGAIVVAAAYSSLLPLLVRAQSSTSSASPAPIPTATATPALIQVGAVVSSFNSQTSRIDETRTDMSNVLLTVAKPNGTFRYTIIAGEYAFPTVGQPLNATAAQGANTGLYTALPILYAQYVPNARWTLSMGKLPALLGPENAFTFQNANIQRGLEWAVEPTISRGVRVTYASGRLDANLEYNDGFYTGSKRAVEGEIGWQADRSTLFTFAFMVPQKDTPGNQTAGLANKSEYNFTIAKQSHKLQLVPSVLFVESPSSRVTGYVTSERAVFAALLCTYDFDNNFELALRIEDAENNSVARDLVGYGPGSRARTMTITPQFKRTHLFARAEYSRALLGSFTAGMGVGPQGLDATQTRAVFEFGVQY